MRQLEVLVAPSRFALGRFAEMFNHKTELKHYDGAYEVKPRCRHQRGISRHLVYGPHGAADLNTVSFNRTPATIISPNNLFKCPCRYQLPPRSNRVEVYGEHSSRSGQQWHCTARRHNAPDSQVSCTKMLLSNRNSLFRLTTLPFTCLVK